MIKFKKWDEGFGELKSCPFCGGEPEVYHKGNDHSKKRSITVKCMRCRCQRTDAALSYGFGWLEDVAIKNWNQRPK